MKQFCPNKTSKEFKELVGIFGEDKAYFLWMRNKGNELDKAPNGAESKLFLTLLDHFNGDRTEALKAKAKVYSNDFLNWFGNWIEEDKENVSKVVDENGEPLIVYRGINDANVGKLFAYFSDSKVDARAYAEGLLTKGGTFFANNKDIVASAREYLFSKYNLKNIDLDYISNVLESADLDGKPIPDMIYIPRGAMPDAPYLEGRLHGGSISIYNTPFTEEEIKHAKHDYSILTNNKEAKDLLEIIYLIDQTTLKTESDLTRQYDDPSYSEDLEKLRSLLSRYNDVLEENRIKYKPNIQEAFLNIKNPYMDESHSEDLLDNFKAYKNGHDGAFLLDGQHFLVKLGDLIRQITYTENPIIYNHISKKVSETGNLLDEIPKEGATTELIVDNVVKFLKNKFVNLNIGVYDDISDLQELNDDENRVRAILSSSKSTKSIVYHGKVYIIRSRLNKQGGQIASEEILHMLVKTLQEDNNPLFQKLLEEARAKFKKLTKEIELSYEKFDLDTINNEIVTQALARFVNKDIQQNNHSRFANLVELFVEWIKSIVRNAAERIGDTVYIDPSRLKNLTLQELSDLINAEDTRFDINIYTNDSFYHTLDSSSSTLLQTLQQSVFDIYSSALAQILNHLKQVENNYKASNPNATSEDIARVVQASRIQYNTERINKTLQENQTIIAQRFGLTMTDGYYTAPNTMSDAEKQLYEWTVNSLNKDTFEAYKLSHNNVYNIVSPDQEASLNVIYQAITDGNLQTLDKELARNYIRIFWKSDLIQAGLKIFDDGHTTIQKQEQKLVDAVTQIDPEKRIHNKTLLDYVKTFWSELLSIAKKIFAGQQLSTSEKLNFLNGITSAVANSQDLDIVEGIQPIYDRMDGNFDSSRLLSDKDKAILAQIKAGTHVRLKSQLSRNVKNSKLIADLKLRLEILDNVDDDNIDEVFDSLQQFLETADIELQKTLRYINEDLKQTDMSTWDALKINYIKLDLIGFYEGLLSNVNGIFNDTTSSIAKFNKARVGEGGLDLEAMSKQLSNDIRNLNDVYTRDVVLPYAEKVLVDFVNDSNAVKDKPTFIKNMKHWLYQDCLYGDLQAGELIFGMASRSRSPIVRIIEKMMSDVEFEKGRIVLKRGRELMSLYNKVRPFGSQLSFANFQKLFIELDGEDGTSGLPTGYFARETNYGRFYADKDAYEAKLRDEFAKKGLKWKLNPYTDQIQLIFPDTDYTADNSVYNQYYDKLDEWLDEHCERRYTLEYYKAKRRFLSPAALQAQSFIQRQIDLLVEQAITERGNVDTNKLTSEQKQKLRSLRKQKHELASPYLFTTDSNGIVLIQEKQGEDLQIAKEISAWNKRISDKVKYKDNSAAFEADLKALEDEYGKDSREVRQFIYDNKQQRINPMFWDYISSKINKAEQSPEYEELKARYRDIINHVKDYNGFVVPDLSKFGIGLNQNQSVWAELKRLEQRMSEIRRKGTKKDGEDFNYLTTKMVPLLGGEDKTFYQYLYDKWASQFNEHPELRDTFANLFTYVDKKGVKRILEVFKYISPSSDTFDPGIPTIITTLSSQYSEIDENSEYVNKKFDKTKKESMQPKVRKAGTKRIAGKIDYTNDNFSKIMSNEGYKKFYDLLIQTMQEANSQIPTKAVERQYLLPQITGRGMSILGRSLIGHELLSSIGYGIQDFVGYKFAEQDKDVSTNWDLPRRPDGTVVNNVPIRFVKRLEKPWLVSTDIIGSVMMYYDMAMNYGLKAQNLPHLELLESAIDPVNAKPFVSGDKTMLEPLDKQFEKVKNLMDFRYYGKEDRNIADQSHAENKLMQSTTTVGKRFRSFASLSMLALNFTTIEVGYIDAFLSSIADSVGGKYFGKADLAVGYAETLKHLPRMLCNLGNPDVDDWMVCAMQYNQLSRSNSEIFDRTDQSRASKLLHMTLMGGYTVGDYLINTMILGAMYNHYRLVDMPDSNGKAFMSKSDAIDLYMKYGYTEKEAINKYNSSKETLRLAYEVKDGYLTPKKEYAKYINKKLENQIAGRLRDRTHLYNGVIPMAEKAKIQQNVWGSYVTLMRNFYVNTYWERAAVGFDYADQEDLPSGAFSRYVSEKAGMVNFETGETGNALGMSFLHGLAKYVVNARRLLTHKDIKKLSRDQRYAVKRISSEIAIIGLSVFMALWSLAFARRHDLDDKASAWIIDLISPEEQKEYDVDLGLIKFNTDNAMSNMLNWVRWKIALLATRTMTERSTFYWPGTGLELIQSVSTAQSYTKDLGYMIDLFMDLLSINGHDSSASVKTGGYSDMSRGTRDLIKIAGPLGIDNLVRNWHTNGLKSTLNWYSGITPNNFILPNKSTWEEQEGISTTKSSRGSSKASKK